MLDSLMPHLRSSGSVYRSKFADYTKTAALRGTDPGALPGKDLREPQGALQIPPLRYATVGMTREEWWLTAWFAGWQETADPPTSLRYDRDDKGRMAAKIAWFAGWRSHRLRQDPTWARLIASEFNLAFEVKHTRTLQLNEITPEAANHLPTTRRGLKSTKRCFAQAIGPVRSQHAMSGTGYRILGNALRRGEVSADKVELAIPRGGHDYAVAIQASDRSHIWGDFPQNLCALEHSEIVEGVAQDFDRHNTEGLRQAGRGRDPLGRSCGKVHHITRFCTMHGEGSAGRMEHD